MKIRTLSIIVFLLLISTGCSTTPKEKNTYAEQFVDINSWYCEKDIPDSDSLRAQLKNDPRLKISKDYIDVYVILISGVDFAITPDKDSCTTDVLLQRTGTKILMSHNEIDSALQRRGYKKNRVEVLYEKGLDGKNVKVSDTFYTTPQREKAILTYPLEMPWNFYMTLSTKKFR